MGLADTVDNWVKEGEEKGIVKGREEGIQDGIGKGRRQEAAQLFQILLDAKFGAVNQALKDKIKYASAEQIEIWTKQIVQAETIDALQINPAELCSINHVVAALFKLEKNRTELEINLVLEKFLEWFNEDEQSSFRQTFVDWFQREVWPKPNTNEVLTDSDTLADISRKLPDVLKRLISDGETRGIILGRREGREIGKEQGRQQEAAKLLLLLLDSKFGTVGQDFQEKIIKASPEIIEKWIKRIFLAESPEALFNA